MKPFDFYYLMAWIAGSCFLAGWCLALEDYWYFTFGPLAWAGLDTVRLALKADVWPFN